MAASAYYDQLQQLYIAYFGRPADTIGREYWATQIDAANGNVSAVIAGFSASTESQDLYGNRSSADKVNALYKNLFSRDAEPAGLAYWVAKLDSGQVSQAQIAYEMQSNAGPGDAAAVANKLEVARVFTAEIDTTAEVLGYQGNGAAQVAREFLAKVDASPASRTAGIEGAAAALAAAIGQSSSDAFSLTNGTDIATAHIFNADLVYTPGGDDRVNSLQSEDVLTGTSGRTDNTLNATLGNSNDNGVTSVTPTLKNIQNVNLDITGTTNTFDARFADSLSSIAINKLTAEAGSTATVQNIGQPAANLAVKNSAQVGNNVTFNYTDGVLSGSAADQNGETGNLALSTVNLSSLTIGNTAATEGFETLNLTVTGTNKVQQLNATDLENLNIAGSGNLTVVNTVNESDRVEYKGGAIGIGDGLGIRTIDASSFTGTLNLDITQALGGHADPANSGAKYYATVTGSAGSDTFWVGGDIAAESATLKDVINGGEGSDTLKLVSGNMVRGTDVDKSLPTITGIETLDLRLQGGASSTVNLAAFDAALGAVLLRNELATGTGVAGAGTFTLQEVGKAVAENGITLQHTSGAGDAGPGTARAAFETVNVRLNDSSGANDLVALTVKSDLNTSSTFNYEIHLATEAALATGATAAQIAANKVENLTITDSDTEANTVRIFGNDGATAKDLTGTLTLKGGSAGTAYTVENTITAATIDASAQLSNVSLRVGDADQTITLGAGDDTLTFDGLDLFNGSDKISGGAGTDTVRAAFSKDVSGTLTLDGIEKLQIVATANTSIDLANGSGVAELAILSDKAVDDNNEIFSTGLTGVEVTDVITLKNTNLTAINFFGDQDTTKATDTGAAQVFNGLTLENNAGKNVTVNIAAALANGANAVVGAGAASYSLGQLTTHGVTDLSIVVANELAPSTAGKASATTTTIANIWDRDLLNLKLTASGSVDLGTVTGNTTNNNLNTFDASAVIGNTTAIVKALGDAAVVTLGAGNDVFNALGSAGNNIVINAGDGNNRVTGSAQSDIINAGAGHDYIDADRGNNTLKTGAGNDTVIARNGNNAVDLGSGIQDKALFVYDTAGQLALGTNVLAGSGTSGFIGFSDDGTSTATTTYGFAVGAGAELSIKFTGTTFDTSASTLNGRSAIVDGVGTVEAAQSNLIVATTAPVGVVSGGSAADVFLDLSNSAAGDYDVSLGAGNDAIVISQLSTGKHEITGGGGADQIVLSAAAGVDTLVIGATDSVAGAHDVVTNFHFAEDLIKTGTAGALGTGADFGTATVGTGITAVVDAAGNVTLSDTAGAITVGAADGKVSVESMLAFLAKSTVAGNVYSFVVDRGVTHDAAGAEVALTSTIVVQHAASDVVVELVGVGAITGTQLSDAFV